MVIERQKNWSAANKTSPYAWDQAILFDIPGGLIRPAVADVFQYYLYCAAEIGRRESGFGAKKTPRTESSAALT